MGSEGGLLSKVAVSDAQFPFEVCFRNERAPTSRATGASIALLISVARIFQMNCVEHGASQAAGPPMIGMVFSRLQSDVSRLVAADRAERKHFFREEHHAEVVIVGDFPNAFVSWSCQRYSEPVKFQHVSRTYANASIFSQSGFLESLLNLSKWNLFLFDVD